MNRLVYIEEKASPEFWDKTWVDQEFYNSVISVSRRSYVCSITKKYLMRGSKILEGGCGRGQYVYALDKLGFETYGIDFADETVKRIQSSFPNLRVTKGDVRSLPYSDNFFDGYWSLGVIEHFYDGYESIISEIKRVLRGGSFLFITFPHLSRLRRLKAWLSIYPSFSESVDLNNFYQFCLDHRKVINAFEESDFILRETRYLDGIKGLKDEVSLLKFPLQLLYSSKNVMCKIFRNMLGKLISPLSSHSVLLVFELKEK